MKKIIIAFWIIIGIASSLAWQVNAQSPNIFKPIQGGTGIGSANSGNIGQCLKVLDNSPFTYELGSCGSSGGGADGNWVYFNSSGIKLATTSNQVVIGASATTSTSKVEVVKSNGSFLNLFNSAVATTGNTTELLFSGNTTEDGVVNFGKIHVEVTDNGPGSDVAPMIFSGFNYGSGLVEEQLRLTPNGTGVGFSEGFVSIPKYLTIGASSSPYTNFTVSGSSDLGNSALAGYFIATTSTASTFPYASSTALTVSGALYNTSLSNGCLNVTSGLIGSTGSACGSGGGGGSGIGWASTTAPDSNSIYSTQLSNVGIGTTSPWRKLSVNGSSDLGTNALAGSFTATSSTATSQFNGTIVVGTSTVINSVDPGITISRSVNNGTAGNGHAFSDSSQVNRTGTIGYNSFDARIDINGTSNYDHYAAFQSIPDYNSSGTMTNYYGLFSGLNRTAGTITNAYGVYVDALTGGTNNYGIYVEDNNSAFVDNSSGEGISVTVANNTGTDGTSATLAFNNASTNAVTAKISNERVGSGNYALKFQNFNASGLFEAMRINNSGNLGIGTTSPYAKLSVVGPVAAAYFIATTTATSTFGGGINLSSGCYAINDVCISGSGGGGGGTLTGSGTDNYVGVWNGASSLEGTASFQWNEATKTLSATNLTASTSNFGQGDFTYDYATGTTTISSLETGAMSFTDDAGVLSWMDLPVLAAPSGTAQSYTAQLDGLDMLTVYGVSRGSGLIGQTGIGIGTTTPSALLHIHQNAFAASSTMSFMISSSTAAFATTTQFSIANNGNTSIGTTTNSKLLDVYSTATTTIRFDSNSVTRGACLVMKDQDGVGYTYVTANNGALTASTVSCE